MKHRRWLKGDDTAGDEERVPIEEVDLESLLDTLIVEAASRREQSLLVNVTRRNLVDGLMTVRAIVDGQYQSLHSEFADSYNLRGHGLLLTDFTFFDDRNVLTLGVEGSYTDVQHFFEISPRSNSMSVMAQIDAMPSSLDDDGSQMHVDEYEKDPSTRRTRADSPLRPEL